MTSYEILRYLFGIFQCCSLEYPWDRLCQSGTIWGILRIKCAVWIWSFSYRIHYVRFIYRINSWCKATKMAVRNIFEWHKSCEIYKLYHRIVIHRYAYNIRTRYYHIPRRFSFHPKHIWQHLQSNSQYGRRRMTRVTDDLCLLPSLWLCSGSALSALFNVILSYSLDVKRE